MTTPPPIQISDEAIAAGADALDETGVLDGTGLIEAVVRLVAEAVAPLIAAQVLRSAADAIEEQVSFPEAADPRDWPGAIALFVRSLAENGRERSPAPEDS